ncbi:trypsin-like peptidase domain-containing protein [Mucilaginibacter sp. KACC 22773]|uniref:trypsin-like peptidase domain-containing protein n=1 Tax=Mucilaginibacter sp. KACC 22773 TaxID=3025671 RepID=UPI0023662E56|nr:trypsin-like peptidase domain-containing protein [Mucilaginibacter sp. KACC 22773]WDF80689.1 trypsin-like peptidase domain-containing protein [Mucilaginibacter sp. KACC 22773]
MKKFHFVFLVAVLLIQYAYAQQNKTNKTEEVLKAGIQKAYPACVRMWSYDTSANKRTGGQFSGVVVDKEHHILTAAHVTWPGLTYKVMFPDGREAIAVALGKIELAADKTLPDVAIMQIITKGDWPYADMGSSARLILSEPLISIAYPESLNQDKPTVRFGHVTEVKNSRGFIKSTCMMEPGDSGGPLFNLSGNVVGLHSAIEVPEDANYDVPVDLYKKYWKSLMRPAVYHTLPDSVPVSVPPVSKRMFNELSTAHLSKHIGTCVAIRSNFNGVSQQALGALFSVDGLHFKTIKSHTIIVSKSSIVADAPIVMIGKKIVEATVISRDKENDLVLLVPASDIKGGITYQEICKDTTFNLIPGTFLRSPQPDTSDVTGVLGSKLFLLPKVVNAGYLGVFVGDNNAAASALWIKPLSPAAKNGLLAKDEVNYINGLAIRTAGDFKAEMQNHWPGDTLTLKVKRGGALITKTLVLGTVPAVHFDHPAELFTGGKSGRRDGFKDVFAHDSMLTPQRCGGPVFDNYGRFYGVNIGRYSRAVSITVPSKIVCKFIADTL